MKEENVQSDEVTLNLTTLAATLESRVKELESETKVQIVRVRVRVRVWVRFSVIFSIPYSL
jgi:hypothetical protein